VRNAGDVGRTRLSDSRAAAPVVFTHAVVAETKISRIISPSVRTDHPCQRMRFSVFSAPAPEYVHALEGASVSLRLARLPPLQAGCGACVDLAARLRLRQAFSRMLWSQHSKSWTINSDAMSYSAQHSVLTPMQHTMAVQVC
jgi:hypothetical protein